MCLGITDVVLKLSHRLHNSLSKRGKETEGPIVISHSSRQG